VPYGLGLVEADRAVGWRVVSSPNLHQLPAVVFSTVLGTDSGRRPPVRCGGARCGDRQVGAGGSCDAFEHPNQCPWQRLRVEIVVVFLGDTRPMR
jgi:hypothetical protein